MAFAVSLNGRDFSNASSGFTYYEEPTLIGMAPLTGPEAGGTVLTARPALHTVAAPITYGCSPHHVRLQPPLATVAGAHRAALRDARRARAFDGVSHRPPVLRAARLASPRFMA